MGGDVIMQKTTSEKNNNFEQVRVEILYLDRTSVHKCKRALKSKEVVDYF